jgi:BirA family biotin operon repressor/biotin-[acetyl-CoA-carboxylase] ligase
MIRVVSTTGSTNADLLAAARAGAGEGEWLRAERQTSGRGRLQRQWVSPGGNLYASTLVRLGTGDPPAPGLALVAGVAVQEVAQAFAPDCPLSLKWPNDLLSGPAKLAGILLEREGDAVVIGFGVNLAGHPDDLGRAASNLRALTGEAPNPDDFLHALVQSFAHWIARWRGEGLEPVRQRWLERAHPIGSALGTTGPDGRVEGLFDGLEPAGGLRLRLRDGTIEIIRAGDVQLI